MTAPKYEITIDEVDGCVVECTVAVTNRDVAELPTTKSFAFVLLADPVYFSMDRKKKRVLDSPMAAEVDLKDMLDPQWVRDHADGIIEEVEPGASDDEDRPGGVYRITVVHPGWLDHLEAGMSWRGAIEDPGEARKWEGPARRPFDRKEVMVDDEDEGFEPLEKSEGNRSLFGQYNLPKSAPMPSEGDSYYRAVEPLEGDELTTAAVEEMVGESVVIELNEKALEPGPVVGLLAQVDDGILYVYTELQGHGQMKAASLASIASIGRARYVRRVIEPSSDDTEG